MADSKLLCLPPWGHPEERSNERSLSYQSCTVRIGVTRCARYDVLAGCLDEHPETSDFSVLLPCGWPQQIRLPCPWRGKPLPAPTARLDHRDSLWQLAAGWPERRQACCS